MGQYNNIKKLYPSGYHEKKHIFLNKIPIRVGIREHLSDEECEVISSGKSLKRKNIRDKSLDYYENPYNISKEERHYAINLAFYRRITLPMEYAMSISSDKSYPCNQLSNFKNIDYLFEKYYDKFDNMNFKSDKIHMDFREYANRVVFRLWLCGYGIFPGYTNNFITEEILDRILEVTNQKHSKNLCDFLRFALSHEDRSPINSMPKIRTKALIKDSELKKWNKVLYKYNTEITRELHRFVFESLYPRTESATIDEIKDDNDKIQSRISNKKIAMGTFKSHSRYLKYLCEMLNQNGYITIDQAMKEGILFVLTRYTDECIDLSTKDRVKAHIKSIARQWVSWYINVNNIDININNIIPISVKNKERTFGRVLNYRACYELIDALITDKYNFDNNSVLDYRMRRACLLQLSTGQRISEISLMPYDCIKTDKKGTKWVVFHKTKTGDNKVVATKDIREIINELREKSPKKKILISRDKYSFGDDLEIRRLLANSTNIGPIIDSNTNNYLKRLQNRLWGEENLNKSTITSHDLRRMRAVYMKLIGKTNEEIQEQLGHGNIESQVPYLQTKPLYHQKYFEEIQLDGIYSHITNNPEEGVIELQSVINKSIELNNHFKDNTPSLIKSILETMSDIEEIHVPNPDIVSLVPTGFPLRLHSCTSENIVNCDNTELRCFKCDYYVPDLNTLEDHKVEIFRYMLLVIYQGKEIKKTKNIVINQLLKSKSVSIEEDINKTFENLFVKFKLNYDEIKMIRINLEKLSSKYSRKNSKSNPVPSFNEAKKFIEEKLIWQNQLIQNQT